MAPFLYFASRLQLTPSTLYLPVQPPKEAMTTDQSDNKKIKSYLHAWINAKISPEGLEWLTGKLEQLATAPSDRNLFLAFGAAPRFVGKEPLRLTKKEVEQADSIRTGWNPSHWTADQATRILLLLSLPNNDPDKLVNTLNQLFSTAEVGELTALYLSLPLLPYPEQHRFRATEGFRTNMNVVFNAVALDNPYPAEYLDEPAWNQMVLKAIFIGSPLHRIYGLDARSNPTLARILSDFAHERWAAKRTVPVELWRVAGPHMDEKILPDMVRLFSQGTEAEQEAAALACAASGQESAGQLLIKHRPDLKEKIQKGELSWDKLVQ